MIMSWKLCPHKNTHTDVYSSFTDIFLKLEEIKKSLKRWVDRQIHVVECSVSSLSHAWLFETPWTAARQASLSITNSQNLLKLVSIGSVMPSNHLILCRPFSCYSTTNRNEHQAVKSLEEMSMHVANLKKSVWKGNIFYSSTVWHSEKSKIVETLSDQWLPGVLVARAVGSKGEGYVEHGEFLGQWNNSAWYCYGGHVMSCIC